MKRKCTLCDYYDNGFCDMGENGSEYDEPSCMLGHTICNLKDEEEKRFCCYLSEKSFKKKEMEYAIAQDEESIYWTRAGLMDDYIHQVIHELLKAMATDPSMFTTPSDVHDFLSYNDISLGVNGLTEQQITKKASGEIIEQ